MVSRVGSSGGGKTYKKARPTTYYAVLAVIVVLGLSVVGYSRYELTHPHVVTNPTPHAGTLNYAAVATEECGTTLPALTPNPGHVFSFSMLPSNVMKISPQSSATAGAKSTAAVFLRQYNGLEFSSRALTVGIASGSPKTYVAGEKCAAGTKYAGKDAYPVIASWANIAQTKPTLTTDAASVHLDNSVMVVFAYEPKGVDPVRPSNATIEAMVALQEAASTTTTLPVTTTTKPVTTTTAKK